MVNAPRDHAARNGSVKEDAELLGELAKLWADHNARSLDVRMETGRLLNDCLGEPTDRQPRGQSVLEQAAKALRIAVSELNRMRWFAYFSKDEKSCWGELSEGSRCWTQFKQRLPSLIAVVKGTKRPKRRSSDEQRTVSADGILKLMKSATSKLRTDNFIVEGAKKDALIEGLREFASAVSDRVGVRCYVETIADELTAVA